MRNLFGALGVVLLLPASAGWGFSADIYAVCNLEPTSGATLPLMSGPSLNDRSIRKLDSGTRVENWGRQGDWMQVDVLAPGRPSGWVHAEKLCLVEDH